MLLVHLLAHCHKEIQRNILQLLVGAAQVDGNGLFLSLLIAHNHDIRILVLLEGLDLLLHILVAVVCLGTNAGLLETLRNFLRIRIVLCTDRHDAHLHRRQPEGEGALEVLDQDTDETLHGTEDGSVQHNRSLLGAVLRHILQIEVQRQLEVKLNGTHLPLSSQRIPHLQVDLRPVECAVAFIHLVVALAVLGIQDSLQVSLCLIPYLDVSHVVIRSGGKLGNVAQAEGAVDLAGDIHDVIDLSADLVLCQKDMCIVLTEHLYAEEAVQLTGLLFSVDYIHLRDAQRKILIGTKLVAVNHDGVRTVHGLGRKVIALILLLSRNDEHILLVMSPVT